MHPKHPAGILGIFTMPFLHSDFDHLFSNSVPLFLSMGFIFLFFEEHKIKILVFSGLLTGVILWFIGEGGTTHIGASGLVYAYIVFLVTHAFLTKNKEMIASAFILIFLYGSLIYGIFPEYGLLVGKNISWEGHLSGAISGLLFALYFRKEGPQQRIYFEEEEDDDEDDDEDAYWKIPTSSSKNTTITYHFREEKDK